MIYANQGQQNNPAAVCSRNNTLSGVVYYLWYMTHKLSGKKYYFIPFRLIPPIDYPPLYDVFCLNIDDSIPQVLTGTTCGQVNVHLIPGEYYLEVYSQNSNTNLNPALSYELVYQTLVNVVGDNLNIPNTYTGNSDSTFIIYNPNND
jgi:hypothetical protein